MQPDDRTVAAGRPESERMVDEPGRQVGALATIPSPFGSSAVNGAAKGQRTGPPAAGTKAIPPCSASFEKIENAIVVPSRDHAGSETSVQAS
jgi:hypothetical protein